MRMNVKVLMLFTFCMIWIIAIIIQSCNQDKKKPQTNDKQIGRELPAGPPSDDEFLGSETCKSCHSAAYEDWNMSHHDLAMQKATNATVLGNFNNVTFENKGIKTRFFKKDGDFYVNTEGPDGEYKDFKIVYTFGVEPLQQYIVKFPKGRFQCLHTAWDTQKNKWFDLYPDEKFHHQERLHWTKGAMNWNHMCASCHSTNVQKNFNEQTDGYNTTYSIIDVSCEACHGPGKQHVDWAKQSKDGEYEPEEVKAYLHLTTGQTAKMQVNECARCHALRTEVTDFYAHEGEFMDYYFPSVLREGQYHADGQILGEVYVYGSFLQSKMYNNGVKCSNCHNPHSLDLKVTGNALCTQCHEQDTYDTEAHHFHPLETDGAECINCHMSGRVYMGNDYRRDHSFRVPRPDLSVEHGTPNACNDCHTDQTKEWAAKWVKEWYGDIRTDHYAEILIKGRNRDPHAIPQLTSLASDTSQPVMARTTAIWYMGQMMDRKTVNNIKNYLTSDEPLLRHTAANALEVLPNQEKAQIYPDLLSDKIRSVRLEAVSGLIGVSGNLLSEEEQQLFTNSLKEYKQALASRADFPGGQLEKAVYYEKIGDLSKAEAAYLNALEKDNYFNMARMNLANLYYRQQKHDKAEDMFLKVIDQEPDFGETYYSLGLLYAEQRKLQKAKTFLKQAVEKMENNERVYYNYGLILQNMGDIKGAENAFSSAIDKYPRSTANIYALAHLKYKNKAFSAAKKLSGRLLKIAPNNQQYQQFDRMLNQH